MPHAQKACFKKKNWTHEGPSIQKKESWTHEGPSIQKKKEEKR